MTTDDPPSKDSDANTDNVRSRDQPAAPKRGGFFSVPPGVKRIFDRFPVITYDENPLPIRAPKERDENTLYVFATEAGARRGIPSYNPGCLKWQTVLKFSEVPFRVVSSSNHASPSGALPFLLPRGSSTLGASPQEVVPSNKLRKWLSSQKAAVKVGDETDVRHEAYTSLLDHQLRKAWLYQLYLLPSNAATLRQLYVDSCSTNLIVRTAIQRQLHDAASGEIIKASTSDTIAEVEIMKDAEEALEALATLLGDDEWFFGRQNPGFFDASVFAYTHLILDKALAWESNPLAGYINEHSNLVQHSQRIVDLYYS